MSRVLAVFLVGFLATLAWAGSPAMDKLLAQVQQLEEQIPGYGGAYYDRESHEIVIRIVPHLNPELSKELGKQAGELPIGSELRLPRDLAQKYEQIFRKVRLGGFNKDKLIRFEVGKYTWSQHLLWRKQLLRFRNNKRSMASYGYPIWPKNCTIYYAGMRNVMDDVTYILIHETCDDAFIEALLLALEQRLKIPRDALEVWRVPNWTAVPLNKRP